MRKMSDEISSRFIPLKDSEVENVFIDSAGIKAGVKDHKGAFTQTQANNTINFRDTLRDLMSGVNVNGKELRIQKTTGYDAEDMVSRLIADEYITDQDGYVIPDPKTGQPQLKRGNDSKKWVRWNRMVADRLHKDMRVAQDASYFMYPEEVRVYRPQIQRYIRWQEPEPAEGFWQTKNIGPGHVNYRWFNTNDIPAPGETKTFQQKGQTLPTIKENNADLLGFYYDYHMSMIEKDQSVSSGAAYLLEPRKQEFVIQQLTKSLAVWQQYYKFRGTSVTGLTDLGITGLINDANVSNQTTIGSSGTLTTYGYIISAAASLAGTLINAKRKPPFVLDLTPGVLVQATKNFNTTWGNTELLALYNMITAGPGGKSALFSAIRMNPFLIGGSEGNSSGAMACFKTGEDDFEWVESYPMEYYPMPPTGLGVDGKILFMGRTFLEQSSAVAYGGSLTTNVF